MTDSKTLPLTIYDLPGSQGQFHFHGDAAFGSIQAYGPSSVPPMRLNAYECAMGDLYAQQLGLKKVDPK